MIKLIFLNSILATLGFLFKTRSGRCRLDMVIKLVNSLRYLRWHCQNCQIVQILYCNCPRSFYVKECWSWSSALIENFLGLKSQSQTLRSKSDITIGVCQIVITGTVWRSATELGTNGAHLGQKFKRIIEGGHCQKLKRIIEGEKLPEIEENY